MASSLVPRPLPDFISQPWEIKSGSSLGTRLHVEPRLSVPDFVSQFWRKSPVRGYTSHVARLSRQKGSRLVPTPTQPQGLYYVTIIAMCQVNKVYTRVVYQGLACRLLNTRAIAINNICLMYSNWDLELNGLCVFMMIQNQSPVQSLSSSQHRLHQTQHFVLVWSGSSNHQQFPCAKIVVPPA